MVIYFNQFFCIIYEDTTIQLCVIISVDHRNNCKREQNKKLKNISNYMQADSNTDLALQPISASHQSHANFVKITSKCLQHRTESCIIILGSALSLWKPVCWVVGWVF